MSILELLADCESFISGFEDDETQEQSVNPLLARIRQAIATPLPTLGIVISGGSLQAVLATDAKRATAILHGIVVIDYDNGEQASEGDPDVFEIEQFAGLAPSRRQTRQAQVVDVDIETPAIDFTGLLAQMTARVNEPEDHADESVGLRGQRMDSADVGETDGESSE